MIETANKIQEKEQKISRERTKKMSAREHEVEISDTKAKGSVKNSPLIRAKPKY